ncbi:MAG: ATP-binding protein, partial [Candidatus Hydrogenedentales bacterium]
SKKSLVVASIPESDIEIGGEAGQLALESIEHTFGRKEAIWTPVRATEGFEVVRRRLFLDCKDTKARDAVCTKFSKMYSKFQNDFPTEAGEADYFKRLQSCYPIHPEVFERLYGDWATLDRFQRTRGVLRLMAAVIHELWMGSDAGLMIMPGSLPLDRPNVRDELTRYLSESWNAVVDGEIDGRESVPFQTDQINQRFGGVLAARRVARTIMLGSAPTRMEQNVRGIESSRIRLGVVQPDENIATFNDALSTLTNTSAYLYSNPTKDRYWYDTRPTLRKMAEDRATQQLPSDVEFEIENRLQRLRVVHPFAGVHASPPSSFEVPDEQRARLVILAPKQTYNSKKESSPAQTAIVEMLEQRGKHPRIYRNMLAFVAADEKLMEELNKRVRYYLAWKSIKDDGEQLDLDKAQKQETENNLSREDRAVDDQINDAYCHLFVPYIDRTADLKKTQWDIASIKGGSESIVAKAGKRMLDNEQIIAEWAPMLLRMELDNLLWKEDDHISVKKLWEYLCSYGYLSRLAREDVLFNTIRKGVASSEFFAYAAGFDNTRYVDLKLNQAVIDVDRSGYLVKIDVAKRQLEAEGVQEPGSGLVTAGVSGAAEDPAGYDGEPGRTGIGVSGSKKKPKNTGFFLSTAIDRTRIGKEVQQLYEEVIKHLEDVDGATLDISLELTMKAPEGVPQQVVRTVIENCNTLKVKKFGFSD